MTDRTVPDATYRLQFNKDFTFADAERLVPYLADLGISHLYASPFFKARPGSTHGYDIIDHNALNPEVGDEAALARLSGALKAQGMGQIVDFVPNHMGVAEAENGWWLDVLEYGQGSPFAEYFDIDFHPAKAELRGKVLLPVLGDHYGAVLEDGQLVVRLDPAIGGFSVWYWDHRFPLTPYRYGTLFTALLPALRRTEGVAAEAVAAVEEIAAGFREVRAAARSGRARGARRARAEGLKQRFAAVLDAHPALHDAIDAALAPFRGTPGEAASFLPLHRLLEAQNYRLAFWRVASDEINYRRFFQINDLAGLRVEVPAVFEASHRLVLRLLAEGHIEGLRIDHVDGLFDPKGYLQRLAEKCRAATGADTDTYVLVEKILGHHERLRPDWRVDGTTGYEALNEINGLFVDPAAERRLTRTYARTTGESTDFEAIVRAGKRQVMQQELASEVGTLANGLARLSERNWRTRDYTLRDIRQALTEVIACFPVYRTYIDTRRPAPEDLRDIEWAVAQARKNPAFHDDSIFDFLRAVLTSDAGRRRDDPFPREEVRRLARRAQQVTSPVMAKGLEDTAFYRYNRLASLNEVGGHPDVFGVTPAAFHRRMTERARLWPHSMLTTATHDTKRGEDVRARINVLTEMPEEWTRRVRRWTLLNRRRKPEVEGTPAPSANDEYLFYQTLLGAWPPELALPEDGSDDPAVLAAVDDLRDRLCAYMTKAVREAKVHSAWTRPDAAYEQAVSRWVERVMDARRRNPFLADFLPFQARAARVGAVNGLAQAALKFTCPGVPDIYQGCELWELSLVDPDNRRPVDFDRRHAALGDLRRTFGDDSPRGTAARALLDRWTDGTVKLLLTWRLLTLRRRLPDLFRHGDYRPLEATGEHAHRLLAFERRHGGRRLVVVVPRLVLPLMPGDDDWPLGTAWGNTALPLEDAASAGALRDVLTGERMGAETTAAGDLLRHLPLAVLINED